MKDTWLDFVREVFPDATQDDADFYLFNVTAYPCTTDREYLKKQLIDFRDMSAKEWNKYNGQITGIYKSEPQSKGE